MFEILEVFRPSERRGPVLIGRVTSGSITVGTQLIVTGAHPTQVEVIAVDAPTEKSETEGTISLVVTPDLGEVFHGGARLAIGEVH